MGPSGIEIFLLLLHLIVLGGWIWSIIWAYNDADKRGKPPALVALLVAIISWPLSVLVWLVFRPEIQVPEP